ncbi:unnamed protein product [Mytilus coruscus]|uniref:Uncharacterized protein n=1 Tax=Mytilus coruscus TaxID=42192 RepID=A0A6J8F3U7_MYTCO|nr:unnamed protein product [Mytilus coruscus]
MPYSIKDDSLFNHSKRDLESKRKYLKAMGKGNKKLKADTLEKEEIDMMYEKNVLRVGNPESLLNTVSLNNGMMLGSFCTFTILPLLVAVYVQNEYVPFVLKDCYSYENMDHFLTMGTLEQIRCLQQYMLTFNNGILRNELNDLLRIPVSMAYLRNGGKQMMDILPINERKTYDLHPETFKHLTVLIKNRAKRSERHKLKFGHTHHSPSDLEQIAKDIVQFSPAPNITNRFPIHWNSTDTRTIRNASADTSSSLDQTVNVENLVKHLDKHRS